MANVSRRIRRAPVRRRSITQLETPCREWWGPVDKDGYGLTSHRGKCERIHRVVFSFVHGEQPQEVVVMHRCDNPACFRFDHLVAGTNLDNIADRTAKKRTARGRGWPSTSGEDHNQAKLTQVQVDEIRRRIAGGAVQRHLAFEFGVCPATITLIKQRKNWSHS